MFSYILRNTSSMDAKMYSKMPTYFFCSSDCLLFFIFGYSTDMLKAWINLNFVQIQSLPKELADLEHLKNRIIFGVVTQVLFSSFLFLQITSTIIKS